MAKPTPEQLAAALRENLKKRKRVATGKNNTKDKETPDEKRAHDPAHPTP